MKMIRHANRQLMGMVIIVLLLIAIFAVLEGEYQLTCLWSNNTPEL